MVTATPSLCFKPGYIETVRPSADTSKQLKSKQGAAYGLTEQTASALQVDYLIPLELGGSTEITNVWLTNNLWALDKPLVNVAVNHEVCAGRMSLSDAQSQIVSNWEQFRSLLPRR